MNVRGAGDGRIRGKQVRGAIITGWGKCRPPLSLTNADLERLVDTSDEWIRERTGITSRGMCHLETTDMAEVAARHALAAAGLEPGDLDLVVMATVTPEISCPSNACVLQDRLGANGAAAFDLNAACSGFVYGLATVSSMVRAGVVRRALLVGAEKLHFVMDYQDRNTCVLFGDGAGAVVVEAGSEDVGVLAVDLGADGGIGSTMVFPTLGTRGELSSFRDPAVHRLHFEGQAVFKIAVRGMTESVQRALDSAGLTVDDVDLVVPHQANERIISAAARRLGVPDDRVVLNIATHGNTSAASIPMALTDALDSGRVSPGDTVVFTAFGGGVTWGSIVLRWADRTTRIATSDAELPAPTGDVFDLLADNRAFFAPIHDT
ncbi:MAG: beta-ketoacyl-ACP synthase III [Ilumatobacteraceae bacterium]